MTRLIAVLFLFGCANPFQGDFDVPAEIIYQTDTLYVATDTVYIHTTGGEDLGHYAQYKWIETDKATNTGRIEVQFVVDYVDEEDQFEGKFWFWTVVQQMDSYERLETEFDVDEPITAFQTYFTGTMATTFRFNMDTQTHWMIISSGVRW